MDRIEKLRLEALNRNHCNDEFFYRFYSNYSSNPDMTFMKRYADAYKFAFSTLVPAISDGELIVGRCDNIMTEREEAEWESTIRQIAVDECRRAGGGQDSHMAFDYELLLNKGISGIIADIDGYLADCEQEKREYYNTCKACLEAVIIHSHNYADHAIELLEKTDDENRRKELKKIAEVCRRVPEYPPESFYEALQSVHFVTHCISLNPFRFGPQQFQLGHPDRYLLPYYRKDIENGVITKEHAQFLLDLLGIQINVRVPSGLSSGYMVGGTDKHGRIVENELTEMLMQVIDDIRLVYPAVGLCYVDGMDEKYLLKACEILSHGRSHPAIFGDEVIRKGLAKYGVPEDEAHEYIHGTCVEINPVGSSNAWVASPYVNMPHFLLKSMEREYGSFEELLCEVFVQLDEVIRYNCETYDKLRKDRKENSLNPLLSCFINDCLAEGKDIERGGARYNWIMPSFVGMANLVDSLYVVKQVVFDKKELTMAQLKEITDSDFEGNEALRLKFLNGIPKYGNDNDEVDGYFGLIAEHITQECKKYDCKLKNGNYIPSVFCWIMHEWFGRETGATPDGRVAGFPLGDGSGPCQGREMKGPTASILSSTKWSHSDFIGGVAVNMKFSKSSLGANSLETMKNLIKTFIARGGFEIQINVIDKKTLERAVEHPEEYGDLVVRIGGYSDYFTRISPAMQKEVILRTEHEI